VAAPTTIAVPMIAPLVFPFRVIAAPAAAGDESGSVLAPVNQTQLLNARRPARTEVPAGRCA
jgi:hypothetical protein